MRCAFGLATQQSDICLSLLWSYRDEINERGNPQKIVDLKNKLRSLELSASKLTVPNEFGSILQKEGGVGLNAVTSHDSTEYFISMPSNKLELWMAMEAERFRFDSQNSHSSRSVPCFADHACLSFDGVRTQVPRISRPILGKGSHR